MTSLICGGAPKNRVNKRENRNRLTDTENKRFCGLNPVSRTFSFFIAALGNEIHHFVSLVRVVLKQGQFDFRPYWEAFQIFGYGRAWGFGFREWECPET